MLADEINKGTVFFFAGAGVSRESGLVMPNDAIEYTCRKLLPSFNDADLMTLPGTRVGGVTGFGTRGIQPELFYSALIDCCHNNHCLDVWKSLRPDMWEKFNKTSPAHPFQPVPNLNHYFIVNYSNINKVPIFTTNFDPMFEQAAETLGINYEVLTHLSDPGIIKNDKLYICKVHGSVPMTGDITPDDICTTLDKISAENGKWLNCIAALSASKHLCLIGYSGRDVDYFPNLCTMKHGQTFWIPTRDDVTRDNAAMMGAETSDKYPGQFLTDEFSSDPLLWPKIALSTADNERSKTTFLEFLVQHIDPWDEIQLNPDIVWSHLMIVSGNIGEAARAIQNIDESVLGPVDLLTYQNDMGVILREQADYPSYRRMYKLIARETNDWAQKMNARFQIISSYQMEIPQTHKLAVPKRMILGRRPELLLYMMLAYVRLLKDIDKKVRESDDRFSKTISC